MLTRPEGLSVHERRHAAIALLLIIAPAWALWAWTRPHGLPSALLHKTIPVIIAAAALIYLFFALSSDKPRSGGNGGDSGGDAPGA